MADSASSSALPTAATFLVLGATGGIGAAVSQSLAGSGHRVVLAARDRSRLADVALPTDSMTFEIDATHPGAIDDCFRAAAEFAGDQLLAGVVNCIGSLLLKPAHLTSDAEWDSVIATNLTSAFGVVRAAAKIIKRNTSVVLCSSAAASFGLANHDGIAAAKAGIEGLVRSAAASYASRGIRVNAVAPGLINTPLTSSITGNERALDASAKMHPLQRIGEPADIASAITWLLSPTNSWVTGSVFHIDGGLSQVRPVQRG